MRLRVIVASAVASAMRLLLASAVAVALLLYQSLQVKILPTQILGLTSQKAPHSAGLLGGRRA